MAGFADLLGNVSRLDDQLTHMQAAGRVDREVDGTLEDIIQFVVLREQFWSQGPPNPQTFSMYHSWRNLRLIFSRMRIRFANAHKASDNPLVVDHARETIPKVLSLLADLVSLEKEPSDRETDVVLERVRELRASARRTDMILSQSEELKEVDHRKLTEAFEELLKPLAALAET